MAKLLYWIALHCTGVANEVAGECKSKKQTLDMLGQTFQFIYATPKCTNNHSHFTTCRSHRASGLLTGGPVRQKGERKYLDLQLMTIYTTSCLLMIALWCII